MRAARALVNASAQRGVRRRTRRPAQRAVRGARIAQPPAKATRLLARHGSATAPAATHRGAGSRAATCWRIDLRRSGAFGKKPHFHADPDMTRSPRQSKRTCFEQVL
ncbi:hypothetical protein [Xanthomonas graminis]|uniref:hypothetical protein n=1 Tax=Xanthomonas graminis TaxID=3390026 RepID=UPI0009BEE929|nr:hypothetical protein [Xanthomonas translucens]